MAEYGCFSQLHPGTKLRIIGLNNYVLDFTNLYVLGNSTNPLGLVHLSSESIANLAGE